MPRILYYFFENKFIILVRKEEWMLFIRVFIDYLIQK